MIRARSDQQVRTSAAQMDHALAQLEPAQLVELTAARRAWHDTGHLPTITPTLLDALSHPTAAAWDEVFITAARRELSGPDRNVRT